MIIIIDINSSTTTQKTIDQLSLLYYQFIIDVSVPDSFGYHDLVFSKLRVKTMSSSIINNLYNPCAQHYNTERVI